MNHFGVSGTSFPEYFPHLFPIRWRRFELALASDALQGNLTVGKAIYVMLPCAEDG